MGSTYVKGVLPWQASARSTNPMALTTYEGGINGNFRTEVGSRIP